MTRKQEGVGDYVEARPDKLHQECNGACAYYMNVRYSDVAGEHASHHLALALAHLRRAIQIVETTESKKGLRMAGIGTVAVLTGIFDALHNLPSILARVKPE